MSDLPRTTPGVYVEEASFRERFIDDAPTSITAFIGRAERGPVNESVAVSSKADYDRLFGGLWAGSTMSHSIRHFFENGGSDAIIVRVHNGATATTFELPGTSGSLLFEAASPGSWANNLEAEINHETAFADNHAIFNLAVREIVDGETVAEEVFHNLSMDEEDDRYVRRVLEYESNMLRARGEVRATRPDAGRLSNRTDGDDGQDIGFAQVADRDLEQRYEGLWALEKTDLFNLLCIPPFSSDTDVDVETWTAAQTYCGDKCAFLIIDPPSTWQRPSDAVSGNELAGAVPPRSHNAAIYFPRVRIANPLQHGKVETLAPCGAVAGVYARTDKQYGVWKAPAGKDAKLAGVDGPSCELADDENDILNRLGVNCIRSSDDGACVLWGARTTEGADRAGSDWNYVSVRRLALFIVQSIRRGTAWAVFMPVSEQLPSDIRSHVGSFMARLFRQGVFAGSMPDDSYFVRCDLDPTTERHTECGMIIVEVGFAPLRPARFVQIAFSLYSY
jgi:phage tail sheath protein FI